jgi:glycosyltransferase involved in cell wall biosynthesis
VCTPLAARGVDAEPGRHLLTASGPRETADAVLTLLENPAQRIALATGARQRILSHHSWHSSLQRMDGYLEQCLGNRSTA